MTRDRSAPAGAPSWLDGGLEALSAAQWEALCDRCGRCCLVKLEDEDTGEIDGTRVACQFLDIERCRCTCYAERLSRKPGCVTVTADTAGAVEWLPDSCAYRLVALGRPLPPWHPLRSGDAESVHRAGVSVRGWAISEELVSDDDLEDYVIDEEDRVIR